ncbi:hypothetical protein Tco_1359590 [Tanacetum coccineum]
MCHIIGIEPQFKNIILNGTYVPMAAGVCKLEAQWSDDERKVLQHSKLLKLETNVLLLKHMNEMNKKCHQMRMKWLTYLHKYVEQPRPKVVFGDDSTCITEGYGSIKSRKLPTAVLFDVDTRRISIRHCEMLKSTTMNVLARSHG